MARWAVLALFLFCAAAHAHPVPRQNHDRIIAVHITPEALVVEYRLELDRDGWTLFRDLNEAISDPDAWAALTSEARVYESFGRTYAPLLAGNLTVKLDGRELELDRQPPPKAVLTDSVQFPFAYRKAWQLQPGQRYQLTFAEGNYETDEGLIDVTIAGDGLIRILEKSEADEATKKRPYAQRLPGDEKKLRRVSATFELSSPPRPTEATPATPPQPPSSIGTIFNLDVAFWVLLGLAALLGVASARYRRKSRPVSGE